MYSSHREFFDGVEVGIPVATWVLMVVMVARAKNLRDVTPKPANTTAKSRFRLLAEIRNFNFEF